MGVEDRNSSRSVPADMAIGPEELEEARREQAAAKEATRKNETPRAKVNGVVITHLDVKREMQYHPSGNFLEAKQEACRALVIRELLIQEALRQGLCDTKPPLGEEEAIIDQLLDREITTPEATEAACRRYYENNREKFRTSPIVDVSHILIAAPPNRVRERRTAERRAKELIAEIRDDPSRFEALAQVHSACSSSENGGHMGQVTRGQTTPAFEKALFRMERDEISVSPVETRFGYHILKVHESVPGHDLDYDNVREWIADFLQQSSWNRAFSQYVQILAADAEIEGFSLKSADTPLVR